MYIIFKCAEVGTYETMDIGYRVSSKADYVGVPLRPLRDGGKSSNMPTIAAYILKVSWFVSCDLLLMNSNCDF